MKHKTLKVPVIILVIGLILSLAAYMVTGIVREPAIKEHDFSFSVTYQIDGEIQTYEGSYRCWFTSTGTGFNPLERYYQGSFLSNPDEEHPAAYTIARKDGLQLCIGHVFFDKYLMGDTGDEPAASFLYDPYLLVIDEQGMEWTDGELLEQFDAELISWEQPEPVENSFNFVGFSPLHNDSMIAMLVIGILVIIASMIFVRRDKSVPYKALDKISVVLNWVIVVAGIPVLALVAGLSPMFAVGADWVYRLDYCVPAITAFAVAASLSLRRKGFTKSGFFVQFIGPVLFVLVIVLENMTIGL